MVKAHIQHLVRLVQHDHLGAVNGNIAAAHVIHQAPGGRHNDLRVLFQRVDLRLHGLPAVHRHNREGRDIFSQLGQLLGDLQAKLSGRAKNDPLHIALFRLDPLHHRHAEGAGLAGASGRLGNDFFSCQQLGDRLLLDLGHLGKAHLRYRFFQFLADRQLTVICRHVLHPFAPAVHAGFSVFSCPANIIASFAPLFNANTVNSPRPFPRVVWH